MIIKEAHSSYCRQLYIDGMDCRLAYDAYVTGSMLEDHLNRIRNES